MRGGGKTLAEEHPPTDPPEQGQDRQDDDRVEQPREGGGQLARPLWIADRHLETESQERVGAHRLGLLAGGVQQAKGLQLVEELVDVVRADVTPRGGGDHLRQLG